MPPASCFLFLGSFFSVTGKSSGPDISHSIVSGDNFISPAVKTATNVSVILASLLLGSDYSDVKRFNSTTQTWESYAQGQFSQFEPGKGYNIIGLTTANFSYGNTQQTTSFVYDSTGSRVKKQVTSPQSLTTIYLGKDYEVEGSKTTKYIFLGDRRIAVNSKLNTQNSELLFIHSDHINSSNVVTDSSGNQSILLEFDPYGETVTQTGSADLKHKYTGQERDDSSHLYYYGARYYDPQIGRFITADWTVQHPVDPQDLNRYAYARNNPIVFTDPTGLGFFKWFKKFFKKVFRVVVRIFALNIALAVGAFTFIATGDPHLAAGLGGAVYRGLEAGLTGSGFAETMRAAARGYFEGVSLVNGDKGAAISILVNNPDTSPLTQNEIRKGASQSQSSVSAMLGIALAEAAVVATVIEGTTATNSTSPEMVQTAQQSNTIHLRVYSRPVPRVPGGDHLMVVEGKDLTTEVVRQGFLHTTPTDTWAALGNNVWKGKLKGPLYVSLDKVKFDAALVEVKARYQGTLWHPWRDSNNFIIDLLKTSGRALTKEELKELEIRRIGGIWMVLIPEQIIHWPDRKSKNSLRN